jgi:hypothetical protein
MHTAAWLCVEYYNLGCIVNRSTGYVCSQVRSPACFCCCCCCCCFSCSVVQQHRGLLVRVVPIKESHTLEIQWDIPPSKC